MFNPTKAHERFITESQYKVRIGSRVPESAVSLAYSHVTPLNPKENVQIADMSGFVLENIAMATTSDIEMWPNDAHLLANANGSTTISARNFLITNIFKDGKPLYYMYEAKFETTDSEGPDLYGFYKGNSISLVDRVGQRLSDAYAYKIMLISTNVAGRYKIRIFTDFQTQPGDMIKVVYTAAQEKRTVPGFTEIITPQPAFERVFSVNEILATQNQVFYQASGREIGQSQVYIPQVPLKNSDYRTPVTFDFTVTAHYLDGTSLSTPVLSDSVYHADSVVEADEHYYNGFKRLEGLTAEEFVTTYAGPLTQAVDYYTVTTPNLNVELYTQPDGQNYVLASTEILTGKIVLPPVYRVEYRNHDIYYAPTYCIRHSDSNQIKVIEPIQKYANESWHIRIKNGRFYKQATNSAGFPIQYHYAIPEYYTQHFDTEYGMPYKEVVGERPVIMGERKIKVRFTPLFVKQKDGVYNTSVVVNGIPVVIKAWDILEGTLELDTKVKENDTIYVNYFYEEQNFTYRGYWDEKNRRFWSLDLNPSHGHMYTDINKETGEIVDVPSFGLINKTIYIYIKPNAIYSENGMMVQGSYQSRVIFHTFEEIEDKTVILLAKVRIRPNSSIDSVKLIDTRKRGGGLKESIGRELMQKLCPDSEYYWDIGFWDGEPYSENGVGIIRLPKYILKEHGGRFTLSEVEAIVKRHFGFGNLPIIQYIEEPERLLGAPMTVNLDVIAIPGE